MKSASIVSVVARRRRSLLQIAISTDGLLLFIYISDMRRVATVASVAVADANDKVVR